MIETGEIGVLNVGAGDIKLSFDPANPAERIRAARIVKDMIRRGYALLIQVEEEGGKVWRRAVDFEESTCEYIIADFDPLASAKLPEVIVEEVIESPTASQDQAPVVEAGGPATARRKPTQPVPAKRGRRVQAERTTGVAVSRTAGG